MSDNVVVLPIPQSKEQKENQSIEEFLGSIAKEVQGKNVLSVLSIVYLKDDPDNAVIYIAGDYKQDREILGDLRILEQSVLDGTL